MSDILILINIEAYTRGFACFKHVTAFLIETLRLDVLFS